MQTTTGMPLSRQSVTRWVVNSDELKKMYTSNCCYFSLQFNESTDIVDTSQKSCS